MGRITIIVVIVFVGVVAYFLHQISNQQLVTKSDEPKVVATPDAPKPTETNDIPVDEVKAAFSYYFSACIDAVSSKDNTLLSGPTLMMCKNSIARSALLQKEDSLKQIVVKCLEAISQANIELQSFLSKCQNIQKYKKTALQTEAEFEKSIDLRIYNETKSWELKKQQCMQQLVQMRTQTEKAFSQLQLKSVDKTDAFASAILAASKREQRNKWIRQNGKRLALEVIQVLPHGVLADQMETKAGRGSYMSSIGGGLAPIAYDAPSGKIIFVEGVKGVVDGQRKNILAAQEGTYTYRDIQGANRTVEKWTIIEE